MLSSWVNTPLAWICTAEAALLLQCSKTGSKNRTECLGRVKSPTNYIISCSKGSCMWLNFRNWRKMLSQTSGGDLFSLPAHRLLRERQHKLHLIFPGEMTELRLHLLRWGLPCCPAHRGSNGFNDCGWCVNQTIIVRKCVFFWSLSPTARTVDKSCLSNCAQKCCCH